MKLTILIPSIPERAGKAKKLINKLTKQIGDKDVQILMLVDNMKMTIGEKRERLKNMVTSDYFAFVDDDDDIFDNYIDEILKAIESGADVVTFRQKATVNGKSFEVDFGLKHENESLRISEDGKYLNVERQPFHVCIWKTKLVQKYDFPFIQYGEDWGFCKQAITAVKTEHHIDKVIHHYRYDDNLTRAK